MLNINKVEHESDYWDKEIEIGRIEKSESTDIVISACAKGDNKSVNVREWFIKNNEWKPGKNGICIKLENAVDFQQALQLAIDELNNM